MAGSLALDIAADEAATGLSGSEGFDVEDAVAVALAETARLPAEPGFADEAPGVAEPCVDRLPLAAGFWAPEEGGCGVFAEGAASLPVALALGASGPGLEEA